MTLQDGIDADLATCIALGRTSEKIMMFVNYASRAKKDEGSLVDLIKAEVDMEGYCYANSNSPDEYRNKLLLQDRMDKVNSQLNLVMNNLGLKISN